MFKICPSLHGIVSGAGGMEGGSLRTPSTPAPEPRARDNLSRLFF